jgi:hypothetical protein
MLLTYNSVTLNKKHVYYVYTLQTPDAVRCQLFTTPPQTQRKLCLELLCTTTVNVDIQAPPANRSTRSVTVRTGHSFNPRVKVWGSCYFMQIFIETSFHNNSDNNKKIFLNRCITVVSWA